MGWNIRRISILGLIFCAILGLSTPSLGQTILYVDDDALNDPGPEDPLVSDPLEDGSIDHPFDAIQEGIDSTANGDQVVVQLGSFTENINFMGKNITLSSTYPNNPVVVVGTVIQGDGTTSVVTF